MYSVSLTFANNKVVPYSPFPVAYQIESIGSYHDHKADIGIAIKMTDERYL